MTAKDNSLVEDCMSSDIIIGSDSMPSIAALILGRKVISYSIGSKKISALPQKEIHRVHSMNELMQVIKSFKRNDQIRSQKKKFYSNRDFYNVVYKIL